jgi:hypothetical protein
MVRTRFPLTRFLWKAGGALIALDRAGKGDSMAPTATDTSMTDNTLVEIIAHAAEAGT